MKFQITKNICKHLELVGYEIKDSKGEEGDSFIASHESNPNLIILTMKEHESYIGTMWSGIDARAAKSKDFFESINACNRNSSLSAVYYDESPEDDSININLHAYYSFYDKKTFSNFLSMYQADNRMVISNIQPFVKE